MALHEGWREHIRPLLQLNDRLRELTSLESDINVTSIVAVGDQSHGKTSVIEALSGIDLPRGEGIQTRVPLVLKLRDAGSTAERAEIKADGHDTEKLAALSDTADAVRRWTDKLAGSSKDVKDTPLELTVFRKDQDDLTLIDLPGMTRVAIDGQSDDIEATITAMYERYMKPQETILLNVVNAMVDLTTSKSLQMALRLDPARCRTLLCITKLDQHREPGLYDKVVDAETKFRCPVFCVRNRSQEENNKAIPLEEMRERELCFFREHPELRNLGSESTGIAALSTKLVAWQAERLVQTLPTKCKQVRERIEQLKAQQRNFEQVGNSDGEMRRFLRERLSKSTQELKNSALGRSVRSTLVTPSKNKFSFPLRITQEDVKEKIDMQFPLEGTPLSLKVRDRPKKRKQAPGALMAASSERLKAPRVETPKANPAPAFGFGAKPTPTHGNPNVLAASSEDQEDQEDEDDVDIQLQLVARPDTEFIADVKVFSEETTVAEASFCKKYTLSSQLQLDEDYTVSVSIFKLEASDHRPLICAHIKRLSESLGRDVHSRFHPNRMLSQSIQLLIRQEAASRIGYAGMPDIMPPEVGPAIIRHFLQRIEEPVRNVLHQMHTIVLDACQAEFGTWTRHFPALSNVVSRTIQQHFEVKLQSSLVAMKSLFHYEKTIDTLNHYFMDSVQAARTALYADDEEVAHLEASMQQFVKRHRPVEEKSNREQREIDLQIDLYAYWKVLDKRLLDTLMLAARCHLVAEPLLEDELLNALLDQIERETDIKTLLQLDGTQQRKLEAINERLAALNNASKELARMIASGACKGIFRA